VLRDDFQVLDLRDQKSCLDALSLKSDSLNTVYQLAADMGGMGFIHSAECEIMRNSALVNINMITLLPRQTSSATSSPRRFCIYRDMEPGEPELTEAQAYSGVTRQRVRMGETLRRADGHGICS